MAEGNNWNLTIIAVVALVALVSLVALVMNTMRVPVATGVQPSVATSSASEENIIGNAGDYDCGTLTYIAETRAGFKSGTWARDTACSMGCAGMDASEC